MKRVENECVGCKSLGLPCLGDSCPNRNVAHFYCDRCEAETMPYYYYGEEICEECLLKEFEIVEETKEF